MTYIAQSTKNQFLSNIQLQDSVIRRLLVIAEAAKRVSDAKQQELSNVAWREINGMRNRLVHEYDDIDLDIVWDVVKLEIPSLVENLRSQFPSN